MVTTIKSSYCQHTKFWGCWLYSLCCTHISETYFVTGGLCLFDPLPISYPQTPPSHPSPTPSPEPPPPTPLPPAPTHPSSLATTSLFSESLNLILCFIFCFIFLDSTCKWTRCFRFFYSTLFHLVWYSLSIHVLKWFWRAYSVPLTAPVVGESRVGLSFVLCFLLFNLTHLGDRNIFCEIMALRTDWVFPQVSIVWIYLSRNPGYSLTLQN